MHLSPGIYKVHTTVLLRITFSVQALFPGTVRLMDLRPSKASEYEWRLHLPQPSVSILPPPLRRPPLFSTAHQFNALFQRHRGYNNFVVHGTPLSVRKT